MDTKENKTKWQLFKEGATSPKTLSQARMSCFVGMTLGGLVAAYSFYTTGSVGLGIFFMFLGLLQFVALVSEIKQYKGIVSIAKELKLEEEKQTRLA